MLQKWCLRQTEGPDSLGKVELKTFWRYLDLDCFVKLSFKQSQARGWVTTRYSIIVFWWNIKKNNCQKNWLTLQSWPKNNAVFMFTIQIDLEWETTIVKNASCFAPEDKGTEGNWEKCNDHYLYFLWNFVMYCNFGWKITAKLCVWAKPIMRYEMHPCPFPPILDPSNGLCR